MKPQYLHLVLLYVFGHAQKVFILSPLLAQSRLRRVRVSLSFCSNMLICSSPPSHRIERPEMGGIQEPADNGGQIQQFNPEVITPRTLPFWAADSPPLRRSAPAASFGWTSPPGRPWTWSATGIFRWRRRSHRMSSSTPGSPSSNRPLWVAT